MAMSVCACVSVAVVGVFVCASGMCFGAVVRWKGAQGWG